MAIRTVFILSLCLVGGSIACNDGSFSGNPSDCNAYKQCAGGRWVDMRCGGGLEWNQANSYCDWPQSSGCRTGGNPRIIPEPTSAPKPNPNPNTGSGTRTGSESGNGMITQAEFQCAAKTKGGNPDVSYYQGFIKSIPLASIHDRSEAAKFLANSIWETVGFQYTKEVYCQTNDCSQAYPVTVGIPGKVYYGRGMIQLTWDYNYAAASKALYGDDRLIRNPEQVAENPEIGWATAAWFWKVNVHPKAQTFGSTLKAINGALECDGGSNGQNRVLRFNHYKQVLQCLNTPPPPDSDGWCKAY